MNEQEKVLCFPRQLLDDLGSFQGLSLNVDTYIPAITSKENTLFLDRDIAEKDPRYKQLIPYVLVVCGDKILRYRRGKAGQENRLHGKLALGVGGHINSTDKGVGISDYFFSMRRELAEEIGIRTLLDPPAQALLNDESNEVGQVHFGVVHLICVREDEAEAIVSHCPDLLEVQFVKISDITTGDWALYETWSQLCIGALPGLMAEMHPF